MEYRLQCEAGLERVRFLLYELPVTYERLQKDAGLKKCLKRQIEHIVNTAEAVCGVFYEEKLEECLSLQPQTGLFLTEGIVRELLVRHPDIEEVFVIEGEDTLTELLYDIYAGLNRLTIITEHPEAYRTFIEDAYEETGLVAVCQTVMPDGVMTKGMPLVIDMNPEWKMSYRQIPQGALYADMCPNGLKQRSICLKRNDVHYVNHRRFLDSCKKNMV